ncbi:unnamed protein product [Brassica oleracea var. botrytis]
MLLIRLFKLVISLKFMLKGNKLTNFNVILRDEK